MNKSICINCKNYILEESETEWVEDNHYKHNGYWRETYREEVDRNCKIKKDGNGKRYYYYHGCRLVEGIELSFVKECKIVKLNKKLKKIGKL